MCSQVTQSVLRKMFFKPSSKSFSFYPQPTAVRGGAARVPRGDVCTHAPLPHCDVTAAALPRHAARVRWRHPARWRPLVHGHHPHAAQVPGVAQAERRLVFLHKQRLPKCLIYIYKKMFERIPALFLNWKEKGKLTIHVVWNKLSPIQLIIKQNHTN